MTSPVTQSQGMALVSLATSWISSKLGFSTDRYQENRSRAFSEQLFNRILHSEIARSAKSGTPAILLSVHVEELQGKNGILHPLVEDLLFSVLLTTFRDTDVVGWLRQGEELGIVLTELGGSSPESATETILAKLDNAIEPVVPPAILEKMSVEVNVLDIPSGQRWHGAASPNLDADETED